MARNGGAVVVTSNKAPVRPGMVWITGGTFRMGSDDFYPEEGPVRTIGVDGFWIDRHPVTNEQFGRFVAATGYRTIAELAPDPALYPGAPVESLAPGSIGFVGSAGPVDLGNLASWWAWIPGADWRHPRGPGSSLDGLAHHPVVHVAFADVQAYCAWVDGDLPTEAEWEFAARGGLDGATFSWGHDERPNGQIMANTWQGHFPWRNSREDGFAFTSPVGSFPANGYGLLDMAGNVWEWTQDWYTVLCAASDFHPCCSGARQGVGTAPGGFSRIPRKVIKGGSHLCAPSYCFRYRPAARQPQDVDTGTSHLGFRVVVRPRLDPG